jgi:hypothetical protein
MWINLPPNRVESLGDDLVHLRDHVLIHVEISIWVEFVYYVLEAWEWKLIAIFEVAIVLAVFLDSIVGQVDECIVDVVFIDREFRWAGP